MAPIGGMHHVASPAHDFFQNGQPPAAGASAPAGNHPIPIGITNKRHPVIVKVRDDNISFLTRRSWTAIIIYDLQQKVFGRDVKPLVAVALGTHEHDLPTPVGLEHGSLKNTLD